MQQKEVTKPYKGHNNKPSSRKTNGTYKPPATLRPTVKMMTHVPKILKKKCCKIATEHAIAHGIAVHNASKNKKQYNLTPHTEQAVIASCV
jgi:hypothetical protein